MCNEFVLNKLSISILVAFKEWHVINEAQIDHHLQSHINSFKFKKRIYNNLNNIVNLTNNTKSIDGNCIAQLRNVFY